MIRPGVILVLLGVLAAICHALPTEDQRPEISELLRNFNYDHSYGEGHNYEHNHGHKPGHNHGHGYGHQDDHNVENIYVPYPVYIKANQCGCSCTPTLSYPGESCGAMQKGEMPMGSR